MKEERLTKKEIDRNLAEGVRKGQLVKRWNAELKDWEYKLTPKGDADLDRALIRKGIVGR